MKSKHVLALLTAIVTSALMPAHAERILAKSNQFTASVADSTSWCQDTVAVAIATPDASNFSGERIDLQRFMGQVRMALDDECPKAKSLSINGVVNGQGSKFKGQTSSANGWILKEIIATPVATATAAPVTLQVASAPINKIQLCDQLASHPDDPEAFANGVADDAIDAYKVIEACSLAVKQDKNSPRLSFQLARGYLKANKMEEAIEQLLLAAQSGHGGAFAYLGDIYLDGGPGIEPDPATAHSLYTRAAGFGFEPAKNILAQFEDYTEKVAAAEREEKEQDKDSPQMTAASGNLPKPKLVTPQLIDNIMAKKFEAISLDERYAKSYLVTVAETIQEECNAHYTAQEIRDLKKEFSRIKRTPGVAIPKFNSFEFSSLGQATATLQRALADKEKLQKAMGNTDGYAKEEATLSMLADDIPINGMNDGFYLILKYGCGSPQMDLFKKNAGAFFTNEWAPEYPLTTSLESVCKEAAAKANEADLGRKRCGCYEQANEMNPISQATRKALYDDYWNVTKRLIKEKPARYSGCVAN